MPTLEVSVTDTGWPPEDGYLRIDPRSVFSVVDTSTVPPRGSGPTTFMTNLDLRDGTSVNVTGETAFSLTGEMAGSLDARTFTPNTGLAFDQIGATADVVATYHAATAHATIVVVAGSFGGPKHDPLTTDAVLEVDSCSVVARWPGSDLLTFAEADAAAAHLATDAGDPTLIASLEPAKCLEPTSGRACRRVVPNDGALHARQGDRVTFARQFVDAGATRRAVTFVIMYKTLKPC